MILKLLVSGVVSLLFLCAFEDAVSARAKGAPEMVLKEQLVDFKDVIEGKDISHSFEVFNEGDEPLKIEQVKPDCSCSVISFDENIPAHGRGTITVKLYTKGFEGRQRWGVKVLTNDPRWREAVLDIRANIKPILTLSGRAVQFTGRNDVSITREVVISAGVDKKLIIIPERFTLPGKVIWSLEEIQKGKRFRIRLKSIPGTSEDFRGFLTLRTNFPEKPELTIWIIGRFTEQEAIDE